MEELIKDKKEVERIISNAIKFLEKNYEIEVSKIELIGLCQLDKHGNIKHEKEVKLVIQI